MAFSEIPLSKGFVTIVDNEDFDWLITCKWNSTINKSGKPYAATATRNEAGKKTTQLMHRVIMNAPQGIFIDHINQNTLDNRKENLRFCGYSGNSRNRAKFSHKSSKYKGVSWDKNAGKWKGSIYAEGKPLHLGMFSNEYDAAIAYDLAATQYFGEFAYTNFS